jgi:integrase
LIDASAFTGKRPGELLALTWEHLDLAARTMTITQRLRAVPERCRTRIEDKWEFADPKTEAAKGEVLLPARLIPLLEAHRVQQQAERKRRKKSAAIYGDLVFTTASGQPVDWNNLKSHYARICRAAQLGTFGIAPAKKAGQHGPGKQAPFTPLLKAYALRHTHATLLLEDGVPLEVVADRLGHADRGATALRHYIGKQTHRQSVAVDASDKRLAALLDTGTEGPAKSLDIGTNVKTKRVQRRFKN